MVMVKQQPRKRPQNEAEDDKSTQPQKRGRKSTSSAPPPADEDDKSAVDPLPLTVDDKDDKSAVLPLPTPKPRLHYTSVNSNVTINHLIRPTTAPSGSTSTGNNPTPRSGSGSGSTSSSPADVDEKPPAAPVSTAPINLKVTDQYENEMTFRIKRSTPLNKVMNAYYEHHNKERGSVAFLFDGRFFRGDQTPNELGMEDDDEISAMMHQTGGS